MVLHLFVSTVGVHRSFSQKQSPPLAPDNNEMTPKNKEWTMQPLTEEHWFNLLGSCCSSIGCIGFFWSVWTTGDWLPPFQYGCGIWIVACVLFLLPYATRRPPESLSAKEQTSDLLQVGCLVLFIAGCALAFGGEERVIRQLDATNGLFLAGSLLLLLDTAWDWCFFVTSELCYCQDSSSPENGPGHPVPIGTPLTTRCASWMVSIAFVFAAVLGGYGRTITHVRAGMFGWTIGSVVSGLPPLLALVQIYTSMNLPSPSNDDDGNAARIESSSDEEENSPYGRREEQGNTHNNNTSIAEHQHVYQATEETRLLRSQLMQLWLDFGELRKTNEACVKEVAALRQNQQQGHSNIEMNVNEMSSVEDWQTERQELQAQVQFYRKSAHHMEDQLQKYSVLKRINKACVSCTRIYGLLVQEIEQKHNHHQIQDQPSAGQGHNGATDNKPAQKLLSSSSPAA
jgi:hypothetical protein